MLRNSVGVALTLLLAEFTFAGVTDQNFHAPMGEEKWRVSSSRLRCGLSLKILDYGIAYFEQYATKDPHFIMSNWQRERRSGYASVWTYPPSWRPNLKPERITKAPIQADSEFIIFLKRKPTLKILAGLAEGYMARFKYQSNLGIPVRVDLSPINFKKGYGKYIRCVGNLLPFNYRDIRLTRIYFDNSQDELTERDKKQLDRVRLYVLVDPKVKRVDVAGYTDNTGSRGVNNAVSEARAKKVANYLLSRGLPGRKLHVTWYGMKFPVDSNDTEIGRARNRRVIIHVRK